ncbi:hypothetical protein [Polyangium aurulentum]|uniref:hypothetical protein n=1 Tax=Polyangium aurulentum TaxID=2567896 RepID=UPI0010ADC698|nr:hypothetical protein [Polyangium aurulentum]UQA60457.1 hypothetical protein E8A73_008285 [Polyangium aurulentum]
MGDPIAAVHSALSRVVGREVRLVAQTAYSGDRLVREADRTPLDAAEGSTVIREEPRRRRGMCIT